MLFIFSFWSILTTIILYTAVIAYKKQETMFQKIAYNGYILLGVLIVVMEFLFSFFNKGLYHATLTFFVGISTLLIIFTKKYVENKDEN